MPGRFGDPREFLIGLFGAAIAAVKTDKVVGPHLPSPPRGKLIVVGAGKAAAAMAHAVENHYPLTVDLSGLVVVPDGYALPCARIAVAEASHPVPDERGVVAAQRILDLVKGAGPNDVALCLISGGASALLTLPAPGVSLADKQSLTRALLASGAAIAEINCVRKHLSAVKGGRLAAAAANAASVVSLVISDVVGDDPAVIASGPTVPDPTTCHDALRVLQRYDINVPAYIATMLQRNELETPKSATGNASTHIIARPRDALEAAEKIAREAGFAVLNLGDACEGEAQTVAAEHAALTRAVWSGKGSVEAPCVILSGGELVVTHAKSGHGGPNAEYALALAAHLNGLAGVWVLAADTDGIDGNAGAAGAAFGPDVLDKAAKLGMKAPQFLERHNSARFFEGVGGLFSPGPTYTNVNDFRAILILPGD